MTDFKIRNVIEDDFIEISKVAENCSPMTTKEILFIICLPSSLKTLRWLLKMFENGNICAFLLGLISQNEPENAYIHLSMC